MKNTNTPMGTLYGIGVGPGDEELLTLKAVKIIKSCDVIVAPSSREGEGSIAFDTARNFVDEHKEVIIKHFPMGGKDQDRKIFEAFEAVEEKLKEGKDVAFLTIGDPFIYSTYIYILNHMKNRGYSIETIPGITSFCAAASLAGENIVIGDERVLILPANQVDKIEEEKFVVIMKVYKNEERILDKLEEKGFKYVFVKRAYRKGQLILRNREEILKNRDYMSLIIAQKK